MGVFAKIVSTSKEIKAIKAQVENNTKDIASVWAEVNGIKKMIWPDYVLNLTGAAKYEQDTVWPAGRYSVDVQAGSSVVYRPELSTNPGCAGAIKKTIVVQTPFILRAYCGSRGMPGVAGTNPYSGEFKVNAANTTPPVVTHIFGNQGGVSAQEDISGTKTYLPGGGNCLGDGVPQGALLGWGAGSCLHLLPIGGVFGTDYLFAFHCTAPGVGSFGTIHSVTIGTTYPSGSARGGAGGPAATVSGSLNGGSTPYGTGGSAGQSGTGVGAGIGANIIKDGRTTPGAAAWFNGTDWVDSNQYGAINEDGHIIVKYLGPIE